MLSTFFARPRTVARLRSSPAGPYLDDFAQALQEAGYLRSTGHKHLKAVAHFGYWRKRAGQAVEGIDDAAVASFRRHRARCSWLCHDRHSRRHAVAGVRLFQEHLQRIGIAPKASSAPEKPLLLGFCHWMLTHRGVVTSTLDHYRKVLEDLLNTQGDDPTHYTAQALRQFVLKRASHHTTGHAKVVVTATRMFLRYLISNGQCTAGLDCAVPTIAQWRLAALPRYLPASDVELIIAACDTNTATGTRDRAILLLLARLGLRASDVASMVLSDVDWEKGCLRVAGKGRREALLPLPQDVGDAVLAYLERGHQLADNGPLFLRVRAPRGPLLPSTVSGVVKRAIQRAGVAAPSHGAHLLRHSAATEMLRRGGSLDAIASVLRHSSIETTAHYAKVDSSLLCGVAQAWPEVAPC